MLLRTAFTPSRPFHPRIKEKIGTSLVYNYCILLKSVWNQLKNGMDSSSLSNSGNYIIGEIPDNIEQARAVGPLFNEALIYLRSPIKANNIYSLQINNIHSCKKEKTFEGVVRTGLLRDPLPNDILINEVLFNPPSDGEDYLELYKIGRAHV